jgi:hypothetical protein
VLSALPTALDMCYLRSSGQVLSNSNSRPQLTWFISIRFGGLTVGGLR